MKRQFTKSNFCCCDFSIIFRYIFFFVPTDSPKRTIFYIVKKPVKGERCATVRKVRKKYISMMERRERRSFFDR